MVRSQLNRLLLVAVLLLALPTAGLGIDDRADLARRARDRIVDGIRHAA